MVTLRIAGLGDTITVHI